MRWCTDIDNFLETTEEDRFSTWEFIKSICIPIDDDEISILESMKAHGRNPIIGKRVRLSTDYDENYTSEHKLHIQVLLENIGEYTSQLECNLDFVDIKAQEIHDICVEILNKCPNLKKFNVFGLYASDDQSEEINIVQAELPDRPSLQHLSICEDVGRIGFVQYILQKYHGQLKSLEIGRWEEGNHDQLVLNALESVGICGMTEKSILNIKTLQAPNLKELTIVQFGCAVRLANLMEIVNHFPLLKTLYLQTGNANSFRLGINQVKELGRIDKLCSNSIETIELRITNLCSIASVDLLIFFPNLKKLTLKVVLSDDESKKAKEQGRVILLIDQLLKLENQKSEIYESNVWDICTRLQIIKIYNDIYTREGLELYRHSFITT